MQGPMLSILAVFIILLIFGLGDMVATKTRAIVSMLFFSSVLFLAGFWTKVLPNTMFDDSTLLLVSGVLVSMLLVHMGTTIKLRDFADQWKTVLIAGIACIAISLGIYFIGGLIVADKNYVVVGAPILSGAFLATITANAINGWIASTFETDFSISALIFALIYGIIAKELGFIEENPMKRAGADGFMLVVVTLSIFTNLAQSTPDMVAGMLWPLLVVVVTGSVTFLIISTLVGKIFGVSWQMSCAIGSTCLFGFPGTYIVTNEVVNATATNDEEKQLMLDHMMPKMLIAGMVSVSITSVLIAGYMVNLLVF